MQVLQARESLRRVTEIAAGNGLIRPGEREPIMRRWRREAEVPEPQRRPMTLADVARGPIPIRHVEEPVTLEPGWDGMPDAEYLAQVYDSPPSAAQ